MSDSSREHQHRQLETMARQVLEEIATSGASSEIRLDEYIRILTEYRKECQSQMHYKEAELVHHVLRHLRLEEETRHVRGLTEQQQMERRELEEAHSLEFQNFNRLWNEKIDAFEEYQVDQEAAMLERHSLELNTFHTETANSDLHVPKHSRDLLNLRAIQQTLAAQRNYGDAHRVKTKGDRIELVERERIEHERAMLYGRKEQQLLQRQRQELLALRKRMETRRLELESQRKQELEMLLLRYNNVRNGLQAQQNNIRAKTGNLLVKHACNKKAETSGSSAIVTSMASGTFGVIQKRHLAQNM